MKVVEEIVRRTYTDNEYWLPPSEVFPLIRCKDCKYTEESIVPFHDYWCRRLEKFCNGDWFCADGERKPTQTNAKNNALDVR